MTSFPSRHKSQHTHSHTQHRVSSAWGSRSNRCHVTRFTNITHMRNSEKLYDAMLRMLGQIASPTFKHRQTMKNELSAENAALFEKEKKKVQVTQKEPWCNAMSGSLQRSSRRQWVLTGVTSGWHTNKLGNAAVTLTHEEHTQWCLQRKHHRWPDWQGLREKGTSKGHLPIISRFTAFGNT